MYRKCEILRSRFDSFISCSVCVCKDTFARFFPFSCLSFRHPYLSCHHFQSLLRVWHEKRYDLMTCYWIAFMFSNTSLVSRVDIDALTRTHVITVILGIKNINRPVVWHIQSLQKRSNLITIFLIRRSICITCSVSVLIYFSQFF